jgi:hypothetical protein
MKERTLHSTGRYLLLLITLLSGHFKTNAQRQQPKTFVNPVFTFDSAAKYVIYQQQYFIAGKYFILAKNVSQLLRQKLQGKEVEAFGTLSYIQGKTLVLNNNMKVPSKDYYSIIDNPRLKLASQHSDHEPPVRPDYPKMPENDHINSISDGVVYSQKSADDFNYLIDIKTFPVLMDTYPFMKDWKYINHQQFRPQWVDIINLKQANYANIDSLSSPYFADVIIAKTANRDTIRIISISNTTKIKTTSTHILVCIPKKMHAGSYNLPFSRSTDGIFINSFFLDNRIKKTYFLDVIMQK